MPDVPFKGKLTPPVAVKKPAPVSRDTPETPTTKKAPEVS